MPRYIDAEELKATISANAWSNPAVPAVVNKIIDVMPAADVVEIVRCKDCIENPNYKRRKGMVWCRKFRADVHEDHYCSYGERRG